MKTIFPSKRRFDRQRSVENGKEAFFNNATEHHAVQKKDEGFFNQSPEFSGLKVGKAGDKYETEADAVADKVISNPDPGNAVQKKEISAVKPGELKDNHINRKSPEEEEPVQGKQKEAIQMQKPEEEEPLQAKPEEELPMQGKMEEEEPVQGKSQKSLQMQKPEEEEPLQGKAEDEEQPLQAKADISNSPQSNKQLKGSKGSGRRIPDNTRVEMENAFGVSFRNVTIHTDNASVEMNE
jgi:hypothetical protein